jgi:pimeloyl-ACP methyl ester carboxylesterase
MTKMFVHGVPDTPFMWRPLLDALGLEARTVLTPSLPGFGASAPDGFASTKEAYAAWLIGELEKAAKHDGPVDLVGHDWGALLSVHVANARPDLVRSWAVANALPDPDYRWHRAARAWQTPLLGEFAMWSLSFQNVEAALVKGTMPPALAAREAGALDHGMRRAILKLYRSAVHVGEEWGRDLAQLPRRGLVLWGADDPFVGREVAERFSKRWSVELQMEEGLGHWAIVERPERFGPRLKALWAD